MTAGKALIILIRSPIFVCWSLLAGAALVVASDSNIWLLFSVVPIVAVVTGILASKVICRPGGG